jgi:NADPH2:quinone reductase
MKAIVCTQLGEPEALELLDIVAPVPGPDELQIAVRAASVNFPDALVIAGRHQTRIAPPFVPGSEAAGVVTDVGANVIGFAPGDRVAVLPTTGAFAETVTAPAATAVLLPDEIPFDFAAAFYITYGTAYLALVHQGGLKVGEVVLVLGAAGGVGLAAIQLAKALGATVIAGASSSEKRAIALENGADVAVDYIQDDLKAFVRARTEGRGADIVFDPVGDRFSEPAVRSLAWEGRYLVIGFAAGSIPHIPLNLLLLKQASMIGCLYGAWAAKNPRTNAANARSILGLYEAGKLQQPIRRRFSLAETPLALRWMKDRKATGKLVIEIS